MRIAFSYSTIPYNIQTKKKILLLSHSLEVIWWRLNVQSKQKTETEFIRLSM